MSMISIRIDEERKEKMERHPEINWSEVTRQAIDEKIAALERLERMDEVASMSEATPGDATEIADIVNRGLAQRHGIEDDGQSDE